MVVAGEGGKDAQEGGLARSVWTEQRDKLTCFDLEIQFLQDSF